MKRGRRSPDGIHGHHHHDHHRADHVDHLEESQSQLIKEKERLEGLLCDAETNLSEVKASEKEAKLRLADELRSKAAADEVADDLRTEIADLKQVFEGRERDFEGEIADLHHICRHCDLPFGWCKCIVRQRESADGLYNLFSRMEG